MKHRIPRVLFVAVLLMALFSMIAAPAAPAFAQSEAPAAAGPDILALLAEFLFAVLGLVPPSAEVFGWGALVGAVIDLTMLILPVFGKQFPDGAKGKIAVVANVLLWSILWWAGRLGTTEQVLNVIAQLGAMLPAMVLLFSMFGGAALAHKLMKKIDLKAFSLTAQKMDEDTEEIVRIGREPTEFDRSFAG